MALGGDSYALAYLQPARPSGTALDLCSGSGVQAIIAARRGSEPVAVARLDSGKLVIIADNCPHDGGRISDGFVEGERLVCARHGWLLDPSQPSEVGSPAHPSRVGAFEPCNQVCVRVG